jgi:membrane protein
MATEKTGQRRFTRGSSEPADDKRFTDPRAARPGEPESPPDLGGRGWFAVLKRTVREFKADNLTDWAAALTYYGILALFPAIIVLVSILGLVGDSATRPLLDNLTTLAPGPAKDIITGAVNQVANGRGTAGFAFVFGLALALWSASSYVGAFSRASNVIYEVEEGRPFWKLRPVQLAVTAVMILLLAACAIAVVVTGPLARRVGDIVGLGSTAVTVWDIAKWPVIAFVVVVMLAILYYSAPNVRQPGPKWITPGGVFALVLWILASAAFALYVANFSSYNKTYGALGGVIAFLVWLWITNIAILFGAELNAEMERQRELEKGVPEERTLALEPRDAPKK